MHLLAYEALQPCGRHYCYYGGMCINNSCSCPLHTIGVYCEYTTGEPYTTVKFQYKHQNNYIWASYNFYKSEHWHTVNTLLVSYAQRIMQGIKHCRKTFSGLVSNWHFRPVTAPSGQLTVSLTGRVTSATLDWSVPVGYENIARYGGVWYTVHIQNMATGREETLTSSDTTHSHSLMHFTEYCFRVRPEVSGGAGNYSERQCYTSGMTVVIECDKRVLNLIVLVSISLQNQICWSSLLLLLLGYWCSFC